MPASLCHVCKGMNLSNTGEESDVGYGRYYSYRASKESVVNGCDLCKLFQGGVCDAYGEETILEAEASHRYQAIDIYTSERTLNFMVVKNNLAGTSHLNLNVRFCDVPEQLDDYVHFDIDYGLFTYHG